MMKSLEMVENEWRSLSRDLNACMGTRLSDIERYWDEHILETEIHMKKNPQNGLSAKPQPDSPLMETEFDLEPFITIERYLDKFRELIPDMDAAYHLEIPESDIPNLLKIVLFPVLEEALRNVRRHSEADRVRVRMEKKDKYLILTVSDNGRGFDMEKPLLQEDTGMRKGLMRIQEWVELFDGMFMLNSRKNAGTTLTISLPAMD
ncbi:MAG: sensor histidine kinase [Thermodesulfobacteriota bacterium]